MALPLYPRFCSVHQVIHICDLMDPMKASENAQNELEVKVRKLHGKQTEEEIAATEAKNKPEKGSLQDILANAKKRIGEEKAKIKTSNSKNNSSNDGELTKIDESELTSRMAALRNRMLGNFNSPAGSEPPLSGGGLGSIIQGAKTAMDEQGFHDEYIPPSRSTRGEKIVTNDSGKNKNFNNTASRTKKINYKEIDTKELLEKAKKPSKLSINNQKTEKQNEVVLEQPSKKTPEVKETMKTTKKNEDAPLFTAEQTQELIQKAVDFALKEAASIKKQNNKK
ncbi:hypothetical protein [Spiroplasma endosymbiont of Labia minor]|uniref:hypothetical protein n=1 Tax=Spiroplasma endosymbiont of Labia minor TaxID=3066305 RepID=UPI0030CF638D